MCFSGPVVYKQNQENMSNDDDFSVAKINWVEETKTTKQEFVYKKHEISHFSLYFNRMLFFGVLFAFFYYLPNPTPLFSRMFQLPKETIESRYMLTSLLFAKFFSIVTILYTKISMKVKHCFNVFLLAGFLVFILVYAVWEIIYLAELEI